MTRFASLVLGVCLAVVSVFAAAADEALPFEVQRLSDRVLVFKELSPWESNHVVIVSATGLVLVDPGHSAVMGRLIRQAVARELGRDRFAYVIDTHGHWGHCWGNAAFPEAPVIGHDNALREMQADAANLERYPDSWNVYDSLGEAHAAQGNTERAVELYRRSLELNPDNTNATQALERLGAGVEDVVD